MILCHLAMPQCHAARLEFFFWLRSMPQAIQKIAYQDSQNTSRARLVDCHSHVRNCHTRKNCDDVVEWGKRMTLTGICSEGTIYFAGWKS